MNSVRRWLLTRTGQFHKDGTYECRPELAHRFWPEALHYVLCWLVWHPHLITVDPNCGEWFRRRWLVRLAWGKWKLQLNLHLYKNDAPKGESFGLHCHPLHTGTFLLSGGYDHLRVPDLRYGARKSYIQRVRRFRGWWMHQDEGHRVERMTGGTWSLFVMVGRAKEWYFEPGETKGSSRILRYTKET